VTVQRLFDEHAKSLQLGLLSDQAGLGRVIREPTVNRPGLVLAGFTRYFARHRVQVIGSAEATFLKSLTEAQRAARYRTLLAFPIPCVVFCRGYRPDRLFLKTAAERGVPVCHTPLITMRFINRATLALETMFAPQGLEMGSMVDILGIGVMIRGKAGVGKSESVLGLIERGYSLVSDDVTQVTLVDGHQIVGTSPEHTRNHMEVRGIGIINVAATFGIKSIRTAKRLDLVVTLKTWDELPDVERLGMEEEYTAILGFKVPHITIPIQPGRDVGRLIEVAAFQAKLKLAGHNPAKELDAQLIAKMTRPAPTT
jgi:HPr kinase/phosphorylase